MVFLVFSLELQLPECRSLKTKRHILKPLLNRLIKEFRITAAETGLNDIHDLAKLSCGLISNDKNYAAERLSFIPGFIEDSFKDLVILKYSTEELYF